MTVVLLNILKLYDKQSKLHEQLQQGDILQSYSLKLTRDKLIVYI